MNCFFFHYTRLAGDSVTNDRLALKLVQILIDNYTEIMRIPDDLKSSVNQKLNAERKSIGDKQGDQHQHMHPSHQMYPSIQQDKPNKYARCTSSKLTIQQYDQQKTEFTKQELTNMLNGILADVNMSEKERLHRIKKFQESYPQIYEEKHATIKKALNILGINEANGEKGDLEFIAKKRDFSTDSAFKKSSLFLSSGGGSSNKRMMAKSSSSSTSAASTSASRNLAFNLNRTSILSSNQSTSKSSMTSMLQATSSINFSKLFTNKKKKDNQN